MESEYDENVANEMRESMTMRNAETETQLDKATLSWSVIKGWFWSNPTSWTSWKIPDKVQFVTQVRFNKSLDKSDIPNSEKLKETLPIKPVDFPKLQTPPKNGIQIMWIGHASVFVQLDGINILCDPVFSEHCGPSYPAALTPLLKLFSCKRYRPVPCEIKDFKENNVPIDVVMISHDHYDHLDQKSIEDVGKHFPKAKYVMPMGIKKWVEDCQINPQNVKEKKWWQEERLIRLDGEWKFGESVKTAEEERKTVSFVCTPAQHWCQRGVNDMNTRLWCSWVVKGPTQRFYFGGDTGYCDVFKTIGQKYGPFDLAALPIGAYEPRDYMHPQHVSPEQAVDIHADIRSRNTLGIHWGTFKQLGCFEPYLQPPELVKKRLKERELPENSFKTIHHGEIWTVE